jgi:hypothetical protein
MENLTELSRLDLERRLKNLEEDMEELLEEKNFVLRQTGLHVSGGTLKQYEAQTQLLQESIDVLRKKLANADIE